MKHKRVNPLVSKASNIIDERHSIELNAKVLFSNILKKISDKITFFLKERYKGNDSGIDTIKKEILAYVRTEYLKKVLEEFDNSKKINFELSEIQLQTDINNYFNSSKNEPPQETDRDKYREYLKVKNIDKDELGKINQSQKAKEICESLFPNLSEESEKNKKIETIRGTLIGMANGSIKM